MSLNNLEAILGRLVAQANHYDESNVAFFSLANGTNLTTDLGFFPRSVIVDNHTSAYMAFPDAGDGITARFVTPNQPAVFPILQHHRIARVRWVAPPGKTEPTPITSEQAQIVFLASPAPVGQGVASQAPVTRWNTNAAPATGAQASATQAASA